MDYAPADSGRPAEPAIGLRPATPPIGLQPAEPAIGLRPATPAIGLQPAEPVLGAGQGLLPLKVLVAGGFGVGKTTFVGSLSEIPPLSTEQEMTSLSVGIDDAAAVPNKTTTTVAMDFGRITVDEQLILYLFGAPGQNRFWFMWDELARGAVGAIVLVDVRRVDECFAAIDYFEDRRLPFTVAINNFPGTPDFPVSAVRDALAIPTDTPLVQMDARDARSSLDTLVVLVEHALTRSASFD